MAYLLLRLQHVTQEEAQEVRQLLEEHDFDTYETQAGFFRLGVDAIWLRDEQQREAAEVELAAYQRNRQATAQKAYAEALERGEKPTLWRRFLARPLQVTLVIIAVLLIGMVTLAPFVGGISGH